MKLDGLSKDIEQTEREKLASVFPQCFVEGKLDIDKLLSLCGEYITKDFEKYEFTWKGKSECLPLAQQRSTGTLRPCPEESVNFDTTQNLYIEGDNLEVLKLLQHSYFRQVKMIYIDPPYNTGHDFVYEDDFSDTMARYKEVTSQTTKSNPESMGRFHTNWLNMMYPRLRLAANLLRDDGVIFISIDDNEVHNLRKVCDEVFGEENFVGNIIWNNATDNNPTQIAIEHEYVLCYARNRNQAEAVWKTKVTDVKDLLITIGNDLINKYKTQELLQDSYNKWFRENKSQLWPLDRYKYIDSDGIYTGSQSVHNPGRDGYRYDIIHPVSRKPCTQPLMGYRFPETTMNALIEQGKIIFGEDHNKIVELKVYAKDYEEKLSSLFELDGRIGAYDIKYIFGEKPVFSNPKPVQLIERLASFILSEGDTILDFFSGSATTAHAIMKLNAFDGKNRKYICIQLPENLDANFQSADQKAKAILKNAIEFLDSIGKPHYLSEIGKERIRRAGSKLLSAEKEKKPAKQTGQLSLIGDTQSPQSSVSTSPLDTGFKVFKLDSSNLKIWDSSRFPEDDLISISNRLHNMIDRVKSDRSDLDVVYEIMLKLGVPLTYSVTPIQLTMDNGQLTMKGKNAEADSSHCQLSIVNSQLPKTAYAIGDECLLIICLADNLTTEMIEEMADYTPGQIILAEHSLADLSAMRNAHYVLRDRNIELKLV